MSSVAIFFSYALQFYVVIDIIGPNIIKPNVRGIKKHLYLFYIVQNSHKTWRYESMLHCVRPERVYEGISDVKVDHLDAHTSNECLCFTRKRLCILHIVEPKRPANARIKLHM